MSDFKDFKDPFQDYALQGAPRHEEQAAAPPEKPAPAPSPALKEAESSGEALGDIFAPSDGEADMSGPDFSGFELEDIFEQAEAAFEEKISGAPAERSFRETPKRTEVKEAADPETLMITATIYVEILEAVTVVMCEWISGFPGDYSFKKALRDRYEKITATILAHEKVAVSPTHLFVLMTILLVGSSAYKAYQDKLKKKKAQESRRAAKEGGAIKANIYDMPIETTRTSFAAVMDGGRAYYTKTNEGVYAKKGEREQVPPELVGFIFDYQRENGKWPSKHNVNDFLSQK